MAEQLALTRAARSGLTTNPNRMVRQQIPAFLNKLYSMVNDPDTDELIHWSDSGDSFFVPNHERFGRELLPKFFKHGNFSSFVRQLNMYGFHKVPHLQQGVLQNETDTELWQFVNPHFQRGQPDLLVLIQRKKAAGSAHPSNAIEDLEGDSSAGSGLSAQGSGSHGSTIGPGALDISAVASGLAAIKRHQATISAELKDLQQSNTGLWQEALAARERHKKHQETINKILRFLAGVFGSATPQSPSSSTGRSDDHGEHGSGAMVVRRKKPRLMIEQGKNGDTGAFGENQGHRQEDGARSQAILEEADDDVNEDDNMLISLDDDEDSGEGELAGMATPLAPSPMWSTGKLESVASTPATENFPREPSVAQRSMDSASRARPQIPKNGSPFASTSSVTNPPSTITTSAAPYSGMASAQATQSSKPSWANPSSSISNQALSNPTELGAFPQSLDGLLGDPNSLQRMLNAMTGQAAGIPNIPPIPANFNGPSTSATNTTTFPSTSLAGSSVFDSLNQNNQMIAAGADTLGYLPTPSGAAMDLGLTSGRALSPNSVLALLSGQGNNGSITPTKGQITPPLNGSVANTLNSQTNRLQRVYTDADTINADVDAIQSSINSLIEGMGLDPAALANISESQDQLPADGQGVDFDSFWNQLAQSTSANGQTQTTFDPNSFSFNGVDSTSQLQPAFDLDPFHHNSEDISGSLAQYPSAFLDEVGTASTTSSPRAEMHEDVQIDSMKDLDIGTRNSAIQKLKGEATKGSKRKSDMAELDGLPNNGSPKGTRLRRKK
ncbi:stress-responsive transcription factor hsf1 [Tulasnella sp. 419]|nr:stress-responsive transcription factor hsf1 [Tulasnella sp. 419]